MNFIDITIKLLCIIYLGCVFLSNITYLLGAGASSPDIPLAVELKTKFQTFIEDLKKFEGAIDGEYLDGYQDLLKLADEVSTQLNQFTTFDELASSLNLMGKTDDYKSVKIILTLYMIYLQQIEIKNHKKYTSFLLKLLKNQSLTNQTRIISWNYDYQIENAYSHIIGDSSYDSVLNKLNVFPRKNQIYQDDTFSIFKINGTCTFIRKQKDGYSYIDMPWDFHWEFGERLILAMSEIIKSSYFPFTNFKTNLKFAWEKDHPINDGIIDLVLKATSNTQKLIVCGYSFPSFNRDIDIQIINNMHKLEKIVVQDISVQSYIYTKEKLETFVTKIPIEPFINENEIYFIN